MKPRKQAYPALNETPSDPQWPIYTAGEQSSLTPEIDLHQDLYIDNQSAVQAVRLFLEHEQISDRRIQDKIVRVIHGRGLGRLKNNLHILLNSMQKEKNSFILDWRDSTRPEEAGGVTYVRLAPNA